MPHFAKPEEGSWTEHFGLDTAPVSYDDSISPEHYALEQEAIFKRTWLNVGRMEQLPRTGSYFTRELDAAGTSVIIVRDKSGEAHAFHNICRHRGNKLVWNDFPKEETSGVCRQFTCKYHGWRYDLEGALTFVQQESEFFDLDMSDFGLVPVRCEVWEGFIFVNFDSEAKPLREYMGRLGAGIEGYPFEKMTQVHKYRAEIGSNWKLFIDAFMEFYHAPVLHAKQAVAEESAQAAGLRLRGARLRRRRPARDGVVVGRHVAAEGRVSMVKPIERVLRSGLFGVWDAPDIGLDELPAGPEPGPAPVVGRGLVPVLPQLHAAGLEAELVPHVPLLADHRRTRTSSRERCTSCRRRTPTSACSRSSPW